MKSLSIVKVGGAVVEDPHALAAFVHEFSSIEGAKMLVHGGGRSATALAGRLGIPVNMVEGRRITDAPMLEVAVMVYGGMVNKGIVSALQTFGVDAIGLTGADMGCIRARRRPVRDGIDYGFVGDVTGVRAERLSALIEEGIVPVLAPLSWSETDGLLNTNADTIAASAAAALAGQYEVNLSYYFEKEGVLDAGGNLIPQINSALFESLKNSGAVSGGMIPKLSNAFESIAAGVHSVHIGKTLIIS